MCPHCQNRGFILTYETTCSWKDCTSAPHAEELCIPHLRTRQEAVADMELATAYLKFK
jgi:hypothetical protein